MIADQSRGVLICNDIMSFSCAEPATADRMAGRGVGDRLGAWLLFRCLRRLSTYLYDDPLSSSISPRQFSPCLSTTTSVFTMAACTLPSQSPAGGLSIRGKFESEKVLAPGPGSIHRRPYGSWGDGPPPLFQNDGGTRDHQVYNISGFSWWVATNTSPTANQLDLAARI